jgi:hypothetical protein
MNSETFVDPDVRTRYTAMVRIPHDASVVLLHGNSTIPTTIPIRRTNWLHHLPLIDDHPPYQKGPAWPSPRLCRLSHSGIGHTEPAIFPWAMRFILLWQRRRLAAIQIQQTGDPLGLALAWSVCARDFRTAVSRLRADFHPFTVIFAYARRAPGADRRDHQIFICTRDALRL